MLRSNISVDSKSAATKSYFNWVRPSTRPSGSRLAHCHMATLPLAAAGLTCSAVTLLEFFQASRFRTLRAAMFAGLGLYGIVPAAHGWLLNTGIAAVRQAVTYDIAMGAVYLVRTRAPGRVLGHGARHVMFSGAQGVERV